MAGMGRRTFWSAANEAISSLWMLVVTIWLAREVSAVEFASFAIAITVYRIAIGFSQGAGSLPMMVKFPSLEERQSAELAGTVLGASLATATLPVAVFLIIFGLAGGAALGTCSLAFAAVTPGLLLQLCCVSICYSRQQQRRAVLLNLTWLVSGCALMPLVPLATSGDRAWQYVVAWGLAAHVSAALGFWMHQSVPLLGRVRGWFRAHRAAIVDLTASDALARITGQSSIWVLGSVAGLNVTAGLRAAQIPLGVPRIFLAGLSPAMLAEGTRLYARSPDRLGRFVRIWAAGALLLVVLMGVFLTLMPDWLGREMAGESWTYARDILWFAIVISAANTVIVPAQVGINSLGATRAAALARAWTAPLPAVATLVGGLAGGGTWAVAGSAVGMVATAVVQQAAFERQYSRRS